MANLELPEGLVGLFTFLSGMEWPRMDTDRMYRLADVYRDTAAELRSQVPQLLDASVDTMTQVFHLSATDPFVAAMRQFTDGSPNYLEQMATSAEQLAEFIRNAAAQAEYTKWMIIAQLTELAAEIAYAIAMAPWTFGASLAQLPILYAIGRAMLRTLFSALLRAIAAHTVLGAALGAAMDLIIQRIQIAQGHRDGIDTSLTAQSVESGALGGALGPALGRLGGALSHGLGQALGHGLAERLGAAATGALRHSFGDGVASRLGRGLGEHAGSLGRGGTDALARAGRDAFGDRIGHDAARSLGGDYGRTLADRWGRDGLDEALDGVLRGGHFSTDQVAALSRQLPEALPDALGRYDGTGVRIARWAGDQAIASGTTYAQGMLSDALYNLIFSPEHAFTASWASGTSAMGAGWLHGAGAALGDGLHDLAVPHLAPAEVPPAVRDAFDEVFGPATDRAPGTGDPVTGPLADFRDRLVGTLRDRFETSGTQAYAEHAGSAVPGHAGVGWVAHLDRLAAGLPHQARTVDAVTAPIESRSDALGRATSGWQEPARALDPARHVRFGLVDRQPSPEALSRAQRRLFGNLGRHYRDSFPDGIHDATDEQVTAWQRRAGDTLDRVPDLIATEVARDVARQEAHDLLGVDSAADHDAVRRDVDELFDGTVGTGGRTDPVAFDSGLRDLVARHRGAPAGAVTPPPTDTTAPARPSTSDDAPAPVSPHPSAPDGTAAPVNARPSTSDHATAAVPRPATSGRAAVPPPSSHSAPAAPVSPRPSTSDRTVPHPARVDNVPPEDATPSTSDRMGPAHPRDPSGTHHPVSRGASDLPNGTETRSTAPPRTVARPERTPAGAEPRTTGGNPTLTGNPALNTVAARDSVASRYPAGSPPSAPPRPGDGAGGGRHGDDPGVPPAIPVDQRIRSFRPDPSRGEREDRHWHQIERDGRTVAEEVEWHPSRAAVLDDGYGTEPLTPFMVRRWFAANGRTPPSDSEIIAALYPKGHAETRTFSVDDPAGFAEHARTAHRRQRAQAHLDGQHQVLDGVHRVADWIVDRFPPDRYVYVGLGRSPAPLIAALAAAGHRTGTVPLSAFRPPAPRDSILAQALPAVDRDGQPVPDFTEQTRDTLAEHLAEYLDDLPPDRDVLLLDYTESGRSLVAAQQHIRDHRQRTGAGDVAALAIHEDIQAGTLQDTIGRVRDPARDEPNGLRRLLTRTLDDRAGNTPARADWADRFHTLTLGDGTLAPPTRHGRPGDALLGPDVKALAQAMKNEAFDGLAEYGSYPLLQDAPRPRRDTDRQDGYDALTDALDDVRPRTESRTPPADDHPAPPPEHVPPRHPEPRFDAPHWRRLAATAPVHQRGAAWADPSSDVVVRSGFELRRYSDGDRTVSEVTVRMRYDPHGIDEAQLHGIRQALAAGIRQLFNAPGHRLRVGPDGDHLVVRVTEDAAGPVHLRVRAVADQARMTQVEWPVGRTPAEYAHELGHQLGLRDEPAPGSLMGDLHDAPPRGTELPRAGLRDRHLDLIGRQIGDDVPVHRLPPPHAPHHDEPHHDDPYRREPHRRETRTRLATIPEHDVPADRAGTEETSPRILAGRSYRPVPLRLPSGAPLPDYLHTMYGATTPTLRHRDAVVAEATRRLGLPDEVRDALAAALRDRARYLGGGYTLVVPDGAGGHHELTVRANPHGALREVDTAAPPKVETSGQQTATRTATASSSEQLRLALAASMGTAGFVVRPEVALAYQRGYQTTTSDAVQQSTTVSADEESAQHLGGDAWYRFRYRSGDHRADTELGIEDGMRLRVPAEIAAPPRLRRLPATLRFDGTGGPTVGVSAARAPARSVADALDALFPAGRTDPGYATARRFLAPDRLARRLPTLLRGPGRIPGTHVIVTATPGTGRLVHHDDSTAVRAETTTTGTTRREVARTRSAQVGLGAGGSFGALAASMRALLAARHRQESRHAATSGGSGGRRSGTETAGATGAYRTPVVLELRDDRTGAVATIDDADSLLRVGEHEARRIAGWHDGLAHPYRPPNPPAQLTADHPRGLSRTAVLGVDPETAGGVAPQDEFARDTIGRLRDRYPGLIADPADPASGSRTARDNLDLLRQELSAPLTPSRLERMAGDRGIPLRLRADGRLHDGTVTVRLRAELTGRRFDGTGHRLRHRGAVTATTTTDASHTAEGRTEVGPELVASTRGGPKLVASAGIKGVVGRTVRATYGLTTGTERGGTAEQPTHHYSYHLRLSADASAQRRLKQWVRSGLPVLGAVLGADRFVRRTGADELATAGGRVRLAVPAGYAARDGLPPRDPAYLTDIADTDPNRQRLLAGEPPRVDDPGLVDGTYRVEHVADADLIGETAERLAASVTHTDPDDYPADTVADEFGADRIAGELDRSLRSGRTVTGLHHSGTLLDRRARLVLDSRLDTDSLTPVAGPTTGLPIATRDSVDVMFGDTTNRTRGVRGDARLSLHAADDTAGGTGSLAATAGRSRVRTAGGSTTVRAALERTYRGSTVEVRGDLVHQLHALSRRTGVLPAVGRFARDRLGPLVGYGGAAGRPQYAGARVVSPGGGLLRLPTGTARRLGALPTHPADHAPATRPPRYHGFRSPDAAPGQLSVSFPSGGWDTAPVLDALRAAGIGSPELIADVSGNLDRISAVLSGSGRLGLAPMLARHGVTLGVDDGGVLRLRSGDVRISLEPDGPSTMTGLAHDTEVAESLELSTAVEDGRQSVDTVGYGTGAGAIGGDATGGGGPTGGTGAYGSTGETHGPSGAGTARADGSRTDTTGDTATSTTRRALSLRTDEPLVQLSQPVRLRVEATLPGGRAVQVDGPAGTLHDEVPLGRAELDDAPPRVPPEPHPVHWPEPTEAEPTSRTAGDDRIELGEDSFPQQVHDIDAIRDAACQAVRVATGASTTPAALRPGSPGLLVLHDMLSDPVLRASLPATSTGTPLGAVLRGTGRPGTRPVPLDTRVFLHRDGARLLRIGAGRTPGHASDTDQGGVEHSGNRQHTSTPAAHGTGTGEPVAPDGTGSAGGDTAVGASTKDEVTGGSATGNAPQRMYLYRLPATWQHTATGPTGTPVVAELHSPAGVDAWLTESQARRLGLLTDENVPDEVRAAHDTADAAAERWRGHARRYDTARAHLDVAEAERAEQRAAHRDAQTEYDRLAAERDTAAGVPGTGAEARHDRLAERARQARDRLRSAREALRERDAHVAATLYELADARAAAERAAGELTAATRAARAMLDWYGTPVGERTGARPVAYRRGEERVPPVAERYQRPEPDLLLDPRGTPYLRAADWPARDSQLAALRALLADRVADRAQLRTVLAEQLRTDPALADFAVPDRDERFAPDEVTGAGLVMDERARTEYDDTGQLPDELGTGPVDATVRTRLAAASLLRGATDPGATTGGDLAVAAAAHAYRVPIRVVRADLGVQDFGPPAGPDGPELVLHVDPDGHYGVLHRLAGPRPAPPAWRVDGAVLTEPGAGTGLVAAPIGRDLVPAVTAALADRYPEHAALLGPPPPHPSGALDDPVAGRLLGVAGPGEAAYRIGVPITVVHPDGSSERFGPAAGAGLVLYRDGAGRYHPTSAAGSPPAAPRQRTVGDPLDAPTGIPEADGPLDALLGELFAAPPDPARREAVRDLLALVPDGDGAAPLAGLAATVLDAAGSTAAGDGRALLVDLAAALRADRLPVTVSALTGQADDWRRRYPELFRGPARSLADEVAGLLRGGGSGTEH